MRVIIQLAAVLGGCVLALIDPVAAVPLGLFGTVEFRNDSLDALPQWQRALHQLDQESRTYAACMEQISLCASERFRDWHKMLQALGRSGRVDQLRQVNSFINSWQYRPDDENYGRSDYWATPSEFFRRSGDCEDYAISKYVSLRLMGFSPDDLRLVVVKDVRRKLAHAVLAARADGGVYILDNLAARVLPQEQVTHYQPYYSVNEEARWAHAMPQQPAATRSAGSSSRREVGRLSLKGFVGAGAQ